MSPNGKGMKPKIDMQEKDKVEDKKEEPVKSWSK
jgi:hypothetical protein